LVIVAVLGGFFQLATDPLLPDTPGADWIPVPSALLLGGAVLGLLIGLLVRVSLGIAARRRDAPLGEKSSASWLNMLIFV
jgi:hypothetical protein